MPKAVEVAVLRDNPEEVIALTKTEPILFITKNKRELGGLVDIDYLEDLSMLSNPKFIRSIKEAEKDIKHGRVYTSEEVFSDLT